MLTACAGSSTNAHGPLTSTAESAIGPITAMEEYCAFASGNNDPSLRSNTAVRCAARRASCLLAGIVENSLRRRLIYIWILK